MIKKFNTFNEAKLADGDLLELVNNAFAYLVDENTNIVKISDQRTIKSEQVSVLIHPVISPSRKYTIEEYANELDRWNEIVQDTNVAAQQITDKGDIIVLAHIEGYIRLTFYRTNNSNLFNGTYTVASVPTTTTFTYAKTNANITSAAATGTSPNVYETNRLIIPPNSSVAFPTGTSILVVQTGAAQTTIAAGAGVTVNSFIGLKIIGQWAGCTLIKRDTDTWVAVGGLVA